MSQIFGARVTQLTLFLDSNFGRTRATTKSMLLFPHSQYPPLLSCFDKKRNCKVTAVKTKKKKGKKSHLKDSSKKYKL